MHSASPAKLVECPAAIVPRPGGRTVVRCGRLTRSLVASIECEVRSYPPVTPISVDLRRVAAGTDADLAALTTFYEVMKAEGRKLEWHCTDERIHRQLLLRTLLTVFQGYGEYL